MIDHVVRRLALRVWSRRFPLETISKLVLGSILLTYQTTVAQGECGTFEQESYTVSVCLVRPPDNTSVQGVVSVGATVNVVGDSPRVQKLIFYLDDEYLITDYSAPYMFDLPSDHFPDGTHSLSVQAYMRDDFLTDLHPSITLSFRNGVTTPPINTRQFTPYAPEIPPERPMIVAAVGDGASGETPEVTDLIASWDPDMFLYLGDVYENGTFTEFYNWYGFGGTYFSAFRSITNPTIGNHEYEPGITPAYYEYWDNVPNYYSFDAGGWHFISLNSTSQFNQRRPGTAQYGWLQQDMIARRGFCSLAFWQHPRFSIGPQGDTTAMDAIWRLLVRTGVDVVLTGDDHNYQRWVQLDADGNPSEQGIVQFVVGTGGHGIREFAREDERVAVGFDTPARAFGALRMEAHSDRLTFEYINIAGEVLDSGEVVCHGAPE